MDTLKPRPIRGSKQNSTPGSTKSSASGASDVKPKHDAWMPEAAPISVPVQALDRHFRDPLAPDTQSSPATQLWRALTFLPAVVSTIVLMSLFTSWFSADGFSPFESIVIALTGFTFFWISLSVSTALVGVVTLVFRITKPSSPAVPVDGLNVAILMPIYNEVAADVFGNLAAMLSALEKQPTAHRFDLFILSDTRDDTIARQERQAFRALRKQFPEASGIFYRRRESNTDRKVGNLGNWVSNWSRDYPAMLVLDADSLMSGEALVQLSDAIAADPTAGLIQSFPGLFGAHTLFGRVQQFSNRVYSAALSAGLTRWSDREGNYWGHNAIIRTAAFVHCAGLPKIKSWSGKEKLILSHDFVEAGLLRRAGWSVRFAPSITGSYEEVPATLIDYVIRDRRWCQGNLQHLYLIGTQGFHSSTRFHLISGAMSYLASPAWFTLMLVWAVAGEGDQTSAINYFSGYDPQVSWPTMTSTDSTLILVFIYGMLLMPKLIGIASSGYAGIHIKDMGGLPQCICSTILEILLSFLYAPIMMVQQTLAVTRTMLGFRATWEPQQRRGGSYSIVALIKFHLVETLLGFLMLFGMLFGIVSLWLLPIAASLAAAIALSALSGLNLSAHPWTNKQLATPEHLNTPKIIRHAMAMRSYYSNLQPGITPASPPCPIEVEPHTGPATSTPTFRHR